MTDLPAGAPTSPWSMPAVECSLDQPPVGHLHLHPVLAGQFPQRGNHFQAIGPPPAVEIPGATDLAAVQTEIVVVAAAAAATAVTVV
jgi:hypothetical protein